MDTNTHHKVELPEFINKLKKLDKRTFILYRVLIITYLILAILISAALINIVFIQGDMPELSDILKFAAFILFYIVLRKRQKEYKNRDYSQTTYSMLKKISKRYSFLRIDDLWAVLAAATLGVAIGINNHRGFWYFQLFYWSVIIVSVLLSYVYWYFRLKPTKNNAEKLLKELEE